jgi:methionine-rich copper-binding protein CopC
MTFLHVVHRAGSGLAVAALAASAAAAAPLNLVSASPGANDGYRPFPTQLRMTFNEPVKPSGLDVQLMDPDGRRIRVATPVVSNDTVSATPELSVTPPVSGPYMVTWRAQSASGDAGEGNFSFFVQ